MENKGELQISERLLNRLLELKGTNTSRGARRNKCPKECIVVSISSMSATQPLYRYLSKHRAKTQV